MGHEELKITIVRHDAMTNETTLEIKCKPFNSIVVSRKVFIKRSIDRGGMYMVVMLARHKKEDFHAYDFVKPGHVDPTKCPDLTYENLEQCVKISDPFGDYVKIEWDDDTISSDEVNICGKKQEG